MNITIDTGNAAFGDTQITRSEEVKRILKQVIKDLDKDDIGVCRDINGNIVGSWSF